MFYCHTPKAKDTLSSITVYSANHLVCLRRRRSDWTLSSGQMKSRLICNRMMGREKRGEGNKWYTILHHLSNIVDVLAWIYWN